MSISGETGFANKPTPGSKAAMRFRKWSLDTGNPSRAHSGNLSRGTSANSHVGLVGAGSGGVMAVNTPTGVRTLTGAFRRMSNESDVPRRRLSRDSDR